MLSNNNFTCCFTGHRPEKLPWHHDEKDPRCMMLKSRLRAIIVAAIFDDYTHFITGMAVGSDFYCGEIVIEFMEQYKHITLECAVPFAGHDKYLDKAEKERYNRIIKNADKHTIVCAKKSKAAFQERNEYMVDHSSLVLAVWSGASGGTKNTIDYARKNSVNVKIIEV